MRTPDATRVRRMRRHRSLGLRVVPVEIGGDAIELLKKRGYELRHDKLSIGMAITALLSDLVLEAA